MTDDPVAWHFKGTSKKGTWYRLEPNPTIAYQLTLAETEEEMTSKATPIAHAATFTETPTPLPAELFADTGNYYLSEDEKVAHIENATRFYIESVDYDDENQFGPRYVVGISPADVDNASVRGWAFAAGNLNRDKSLNGLMTLLEESGGRRIGPIQFVQKKNFRTIVTAEPF